MDILLYPVSFFMFWFIGLPKLMLHKYTQINNYTLNLLSIPLLVKTFFHPLKNEYREGLVLFSRVAGVIVKTVLLLTTFSILLLLVLLEAILLLATVTLPFWWFYILFAR